jgi:hypothetical protein
MSTGDAVAILKAIMQGDDYPPKGVADTPDNRRMWDEIKREIENMSPGMIVDIPFDWAD